MRITNEQRTDAYERGRRDAAAGLDSAPRERTTELSALYQNGWRRERIARARTVATRD